MNRFKKLAAACLALICTFGMGTMIGCSKESGDASSSSQSQSASVSSDSATTENSNLPTCEEGKAAEKAISGEEVTAGKILHKLYVILPDGSPAVGTRIVMCNSVTGTCMPYFEIKENGEAVCIQPNITLEFDADVNKIHLENLPAGYTSDYTGIDNNYFCLKEHSIIVFKLKQA